LMVVTLRTTRDLDVDTPLPSCSSPLTCTSCGEHTRTVQSATIAAKCK
jgi:hypothetical protein